MHSHTALLSLTGYICDRAIPTGTTEKGTLYRCGRHKGNVHFVSWNPPCWRCRFNGLDELVDPAREFMGDGDRVAPKCGTCRPE